MVKPKKLTNLEILKRSVRRHFKESRIKYDKISLRNVFRHLDNCMNFKKFKKEEIFFFDFIIALCFEEHEKYIKKKSSSPFYSEKEIKKIIDNRKELHKLRCIGLKDCSLCYLLKQIQKDLGV